MNQSSLRIVVTGLAASYPFGGMFWHYLQYVLGFKQLGHQVLYLEDTGKWSYDPVRHTFVEDGREGARYLERHIQALDASLGDAWFFRDASGATYGRPWNDVVEYCRGADLFLHVSASCFMRDEYFEAETIAFVDTDPMFTQAGIFGGDDEREVKERIAWWTNAHQVFFTFGQNVGQPDCTVPTGRIRWIPTRQPIVLGCFGEAPRTRKPVITTVASWEPSQKRPTYKGFVCKGKGEEFLRFIDLPSRTEIPLELALSGGAPRDRLASAGWRIIDGYAVSSDPWIYRDYQASSWAEFSVAKNAYVASRSGWFSDRSASYLALGVPVVVQDTAFSRAIPRAEGLLAYDTVEEAADALAAVSADYERHRRAARGIAADHFDARVVLGDLLRHAGLG